MELAHESSWSGHLGVAKTLSKVTAHFFWPEIKKDVAEHRRSCHISQIVGKPYQTIPLAPLRPIPVMTEPFSKVVIDCVGPFIASYRKRKPVSIDHYVYSNQIF